MSHSFSPGPPETSTEQSPRPPSPAVIARPSCRGSPGGARPAPQDRGARLARLYPYADSSRTSTRPASRRRPEALPPSAGGPARPARAGRSCPRPQLILRYRLGSAWRTRRWDACFVHAVGMDALFAARGAVPSARGATRVAWPGWLVERVVAVVAAGCRLRGVRSVGAVILAAAAAVSSYASHPTLDFRVAVPLALLATAPLAAAGRFPRVSLGVALAANAGFLLFGRGSWPAEAVAGWLLALAACPLLLPRAQALAAFVMTEAAVVAGIFVPSVINERWDSSATLGEAVAVLVAWGAGEATRSRRQAAADHAAAGEQVRALTERGAVTRERVAIARELHDVVAHHVSMIAVRAATGPYAMPDLPPSAQAAFQEIAKEARTALTELRTILGALRADAGTPDRPQPQLANLPALLDRMRGVGPVVALRIQGLPRSLPESVELCGYRIVQEALTNAGQHSPGSQAEVELVYMPDALQITVRNGGPGREDAGHPRGNPVPAGGFGLLGMRERVTTLGGLFDAGPDRAGGFMVTARVPVSPPHPSSQAPE